MSLFVIYEANDRHTKENNMRKQILTIFGVAALGVASYAATFMQVKTKDGEIVKFDVNDVDEVFFEDVASPVDTTPSSNHEYVDLGLPSGTLWATYNIGATKPEEYGDNFAWGETEPKDVYDWSTYKYATLKYDSEWGEYDWDSITKYNMSGRYGIIDSLSTLLPEDDAATANWGSEWRMPTNEEQRELLDECYVVWTDSYNGREVRGIIVYKAKSAEDKGEFVGSWQTPSEDYSTSDSHVFSPAAGYRNGSDVFDVGDSGNVWSSSLDEKYEDLARYLSFNEEYADWYGNDYRINGFPVRAVRAQK